MTNEKVRFAPFHAINDFMLPEYRLHVLQTVLSGLEQLPSDRRNAINNHLKRGLKVPGFRNALQAPLPVKIKNSVSIFERNADYAAQVVAGWCELHPDLRRQVFDLLGGRGWEMLPVDTDRTRLPGYLTRWPGKDSFEAIVQAYRETYPEVQVADNDISLMTVWLGGRLPYDVVEEAESAETDEPA